MRYKELFRWKNDELPSCFVARSPAPFSSSDTFLPGRRTILLLGPRPEQQPQTAKSHCKNIVLNQNAKYTSGFPVYYDKLLRVEKEEEEDGGAAFFFSPRRVVRVVSSSGNNASYIIVLNTLLFQDCANMEDQCF